MKAMAVRSKMEVLLALNVLPTKRLRKSESAEKKQKKQKIHLKSRKVMKSMKRVVAFMLAALLCVVLCSCESEHERVQRQFEEANAAYQEQQLKVDILKTEIALLDLIIGSSGK